MKSALLLVLLPAVFAAPAADTARHLNNGLQNPQDLGRLPNNNNWGTGYPNNQFPGYGWNNPFPNTGWNNQWNQGGQFPGRNNWETNPWGHQTHQQNQGWGNNPWDSRPNTGMWPSGEFNTDFNLGMGPFPGIHGGMSVGTTNNQHQTHPAAATGTGTTKN